MRVFLGSVFNGLIPLIGFYWSIYAYSGTPYVRNTNKEIATRLSQMANLIMKLCKKQNIFFSGHSSLFNLQCILGN